MITMLASGLGGTLLYYLALRATHQGMISKTPFIGTLCIAVPAALLALCASEVVTLFFKGVTYYLTAAVWPVLMLALTPSYSLAGHRTGSGKRTDDPE